MIRVRWHRRIQRYSRGLQRRRKEENETADAHLLAKSAVRRIYYNDICFLGGLMKRMLGFALFCFSMGMLVMLVIHNRLIGFILIVACMVAGYYVFCCD